MTTDAASAVQLSALMEAIDSRDADQFVRFLTQDAKFRFGNAPTVVGSAAIREAVAGFFNSIAGCRHHVERTWRGPDTLAMQGRVTYSRLDGAKVTIPFANVFVMRDELIADYAIYVDVSPLFA
jgi:ketosteroid isomerase-like protein